MKVRTATNDFLGAVQSLFPEAEKFSPLFDKTLDLMIFTGGEDINPNLYLDAQNLRESIHLCSYNNQRDSKEIKIFDGIMSGEIKVKRILGICRGIQLINVLLGGSLFPDLESVGKKHNYVHNLIHRDSNMLSFLTTVNSMHHQAVRSFGDYHRNSGRSFQPKQAAIDSVFGIPEIVTWREVEGKKEIKIFGVQFHPEFFAPSPEKDLIVTKVTEWVNS